MLNLSTFTGENKAVQRGRWIRENILCKRVPELPIGTVPALPDTNLTMREKLALHKVNTACAACHQFMDPMGLVFEGHDDVGRTRTTDHGKAVDESGAIVDAGSIDGPVVGIVQLANRFASSTDTEYCFVRQNFRYLMGREEIATDGCTVHGVQAAYRAAGGDYVALMTALLTSNSFLFRKGAAQ
jgi:hypothetical protein